VITRRLLTTAIIVAAAVITTTGATHTSQSRLVLSVSGEANVQRAQTVLTCNPTGGTHPKAAQACRELTLAGGDLDRLPAQSIMCTMEYAPVTATATGRWRGKVVSWSKSFSNRCMLNAATGSVFQF
jgi:Subtilisin inhibitor-like